VGQPIALVEHVKGDVPGLDVIPDEEARRVVSRILQANAAVDHAGDARRAVEDGDLTGHADPGPQRVQVRHAHERSEDLAVDVAAEDVPLGTNPADAHVSLLGDSQLTSLQRAVAGNRIARALPGRLG